MSIGEERRKGGGGGLTLDHFQLKKEQNYILLLLGSGVCVFMLWFVFM